MSGSTGEDSGERTLQASARKLEQARERGEVPVSREGPVAGTYLGALVGVLMIGGLTARQVGGIILPMLEQPESFLDATPQGFEAAGHAVMLALAVAIVPFFGLVIAGALLPYLLQNSVTVAGDRIMPKWSHLSPMAGFKRIFGGRSLFEFAKNLVKMVAVGVSCFYVARPIYEQSAALIGDQIGVMPGMLLQSLLALMSAATVVAVVLAGIDVPFQHWMFARRMRMSLEEMRKEMRESEGDPQIRAKRRRLGRERSRRRMMHDVPKATVVITNPTHFAVALRYRRGEDAAPVLVAKGADLVAARIRQIAREHAVAVVENPPLARALHASVDIGAVIPQEHFEAVAKIIGMIWAQRNLPPPAPARQAAE